MKKACKLAVAGALLSMGAAAGAATVTQASAPILDITHLAGTTSLGFAAFDTSLGTLTSAQFSFISDISGTIRVENMGAAELTTTVGSGAALTLNVTGLGPVTVNSLYTTTKTLSAYDGLRNYGGDSGRTLPFSVTSVTSSSGLYTSTSELSAFTNGGVSTAFSGVFYGSGSGNVAFVANSIVNTKAVLTYEYTPFAAPVPEPETYGMLLAGLGLMGLVARRRKPA